MRRWGLNFLKRRLGLFIFALTAAMLIPGDPPRAQTFQGPVRWTNWSLEAQAYGFLGAGIGAGFDLGSRTRRKWLDFGYEVSGSIAPGFHEAEVLVGFGYTPRMFRFGAALGVESYRSAAEVSDLERLRGESSSEQYSGALGQVGLGWAAGYVDVNVYLRAGPQGEGGGVSLDVFYPYSRRWDLLVNLDLSSFTRGGPSYSGFAAMAYKYGAISRLGFGMVFAGTDVGVGFFAVAGVEL